MAMTRDTLTPIRGYGGSHMTTTIKLGSVDVGSSEADLIRKEPGMGATRIVVQIHNSADTAFTAKFFTSEEETPNVTHAADEWVQEPDSSTSYSVGSDGTGATSVVKKSLVGPVRWWKVRGNHTTATSTGSVLITVTYLF